MGKMYLLASSLSYQSAVVAPEKNTERLVLLKCRQWANPNNFNEQHIIVLTKKVKKIIEIMKALTLNRNLVANGGPGIVVGGLQLQKPPDSTILDHQRRMPAQKLNTELK